MTFSKEDIEFIMNLIKGNPEATVETLINTAPVKTTNDIETILKEMSVTEMKKTFGTNVLSLQFTGIKRFMDKYNIQSGTKYPPRLTYAHKHIIFEKIIHSLPKKQQKSAVNQLKKALQEKINNPPKMLYGKVPKQAQLDKISTVYKTELTHW